MLKNKCSVWKRIKFPTFWYNCYYFAWSDTYFIQLETLLINHPSYFFDGKNISFDDSLVIYINSINIPPIMILNRICVNKKSYVAVACFLPGRVKDLSAPRCSLFSKISVSNVVYSIKEEIVTVWFKDPVRTAQ